MISVLVFYLMTSGAPDETKCPMHDQHMKSAATDVDARHDTFGMSHDASHHRFRVFADGGAIELRANSPEDAVTIEAIRTHLRQIVASFSNNDFSAPAFVHGHAPDGVETMKRLHQRISYRYEDVESGGRARVTTTDPEALAAVHAFLKFQIAEHRTKDAGVVENPKK
jgi:hypothetical protein